MKTDLKSKKRKRFEKNFIVFLWGMLAFIALAAFMSLIYSPATKESDGILKRDISSYLYKMEKEPTPTEKNSAWKDELPKFIKTDMQFCDKHSAYIEYNFNGERILIKKEEDGWEISIKNDPMYNYNRLKNFSIYRSDAGNLVIYGDDGYWFIRQEIDGENVEENVLTYDINLPFDVKEQLNTSRNSNRIGEYTLVYDGDFVFYKEGKEIARQKFYDGYIVDIHLNTGLFRTNDNKLYSVFVDLARNKPEVMFELIASGIEEIPINAENIVSKYADIYLPIIRKDNEYYVLSPSNWKTYKKYCVQADEISKAQDGMDTSMSIVPLRDVFKEAKFDDNYGTWIANITFSINGEQFTYGYYFGGYDDDADLPEEITTKYSDMKVNSIDELWKTIEEIRESYYEFYDHQRTYMSSLFFYINIFDIENVS